MRRLTSAVVLTLALTSCVAGVGGDVIVESPGPGSLELFCQIWPDAREDLLEAWNGDREGSDWGERLEDRIAEYHRVVPEDIRAEWDRAHRVFTDVMDLMHKVGYDPGRVRDEHLAMAFGEDGPTAAISDAEAAIAEIDTWSVTSCDDFCSLWPELEGSLSLDLRSTHPEEASWILEEADHWNRLRDAGDVLLPEEIRADWGIATAIQESFFELLADLDSLRVDNVDELPDQAYVEYLGMSGEAAQQALERSRESISGWYSRSCEAGRRAASGGGPGRLSIEFSSIPSYAGSTYLVAVLPSGSRFESVDSITGYVAGICVEMENRTDPEGSLASQMPAILADLERGQTVRAIAAGLGMDVGEFLQQINFEPLGIDPSEVIEVLGSGASYEEAAEDLGFDHLEPFRHANLPEWARQTMHPINDDTEYTDEVCQFQWEEQAILEEGTYELFVGAYDGSPGDWKFYVAAPNLCAQIPITISGDTTVAVPPLGPCIVEAVGNAQEVARRAQGSLLGDSTVTVAVPAGIMQDASFGCEFSMVVLPSGATLNDVGRGDVWPSGATRFHLERDLNDPGLVPILAFPAGGQISGIPIDAGSGPGWDTSLPEPTTMVAGSYDLRVQRSCQQQEHDDEDAVHSCATVAVEVNGETVVDLPELGDCP